MPVKIKKIREIDKSVLDAIAKTADRYDHITLEIIDYHNSSLKYADFNAYAIAKEITGYSNINICLICKACINVEMQDIDSYDGYTFGRKEIYTGTMCDHCVYKRQYGCIHNKTYENIAKAINAEQLLKAFKKRAKELRNKLNRINKNGGYIYVR